MDAEQNTGAQVAAPAQPAAQAPNGEIAASVRSNVNAAKSRLFGGGGKAPDQSGAPAADAPTDGKATAKTTTPAHDAEGETKGEQPTQAQPKATRSPKDAKTIAKLVAQRHQLKSQVDEMQKELAELRKMQGETPKREDFQGDAEFQSAQIEHNLELKTATKSVEAKQKNLQQQHDNEWTSRCQETVKDFNGFAPRYAHYLPQMRDHEPEILEAASSSAIGPRLLEEVFTDLFEKPEHYATWQAMSPQAKRSAMANIEAQILRSEFGQGQQAAKPAQEQPAQVKSSAPSPISPNATHGAGRPAVPASTKARIDSAKRRMFS
jgi:hypothetical protein